jgi:cytochrome b involved in lipid metabolism
MWSSTVEGSTIVRMNRIGTAVVVAGLMVGGVAVTAPAAGAATGKSISAARVAKHDSTASCWSIVGRSVYDLTSYVNRHPGGSGEIAMICGRNGTAAFRGQHAGDSGVARDLAPYRIGKLAR